MRDVLPGALLVEVRLGLHQDEIPPSWSKHYCSLVFRQASAEQTEVVEDVYSVPEESLKEFTPYAAYIGKRIKQCTKTILDDNFVIRYEFDDGSKLSVWS